MKRLTKKYDGEEKIYDDSYVKPDYEDSLYWDEKCVDKLGQLEDIMEKYDIDSVEELERVIINEGVGEETFKEYVDVYVKPYKDIEEELGIDLITLFKAMKNGIYHKDLELDGKTYSDEIYFEEPEHLSIGQKGLICAYTDCFGDDLRYDYKYKDCHIAWAFTKEELE